MSIDSDIPRLESQIEQLRKELRWALQKGFFFDGRTGLCVYCSTTSTTHSNTCHYAKACKLAGRKVKTVGDKPSPTRPKNYAAAGPTTVVFSNMPVGYKKKPTRKGKRA